MRCTTLDQVRRGRAYWQEWPWRRRRPCRKEARVNQAPVRRLSGARRRRGPVSRTRQGLRPSRVRKVRARTRARPSRVRRARTRARPSKVRRVQVRTRAKPNRARKARIGHLPHVVSESRKTTQGQGAAGPSANRQAAAATVRRDQTQQGQRGQDSQPSRMTEGRRARLVAAATLTAEQRTRVRHDGDRGRRGPRVSNVDFSVRVGTVVPRSVTWSGAGVIVEFIPNSEGSCTSSTTMKSSSWTMSTGSLQ